ncbi:hypothetical protein MRB53_032742 [Persea americana]|uniref:Uncharacterized protein n=1 Tax=Persea americana TaxID=3435 RepID=A0ACC2KTR0_PERAE|nr:hypothetical protein MRB53_032742 [Persea americana]
MKGLFLKQLLCIQLLVERGRSGSSAPGIYYFPSLRCLRVTAVDSGSKALEFLGIHDEQGTSASGSSESQAEGLIVEMNLSSCYDLVDQFCGSMLGQLSSMQKESPTIAVRNKTPEEAWSGRRPSIDHLRIFGCIAYAHVPDEKRKKLDDRGVKCVFLGVSAESKAYRLYNPVTKQIIISRDVIFYEENVWDWNDKETQQIPENFDNEEQQQLQIPVFSSLSTSAPIREHTPNAYNPPVQRHRKRPAWMMDYVSGDELSDDGNDKSMFDVFKQSMMTEFDMTDLGLMRYFLGIEVVQGAAGNFLYQKKYMLEILDKFEMKGCNSVGTPSSQDLMLTQKCSGKKVDATLYKQIVGSLMGVKSGLFGFSDSDYAGDPNDPKSTSGYVFLMGSAAVSWSSKKQPIVTLSTTEAEFVAALVKLFG